jgi:hypothetical protein
VEEAMTPPEPGQQPSPGRKVLGCLIGLVGGGLALLSLLIGVCTDAYGQLTREPTIIGLVAILGVAGIVLLFFAIRLWRKQ